MNILQLETKLAFYISNNKQIFFELQINAA